jgi:hypothetical protein
VYYQWFGEVYHWEAFTDGWEGCQWLGGVPMVGKASPMGRFTGGWGDLTDGKGSPGAEKSTDGWE